MNKKLSFAPIIENEVDPPPPAPVTSVITPVTPINSVNSVATAASIASSAATVAPAGAGAAVDAGTTRATASAAPRARNQLNLNLAPTIREEEEEGKETEVTEGEEWKTTAPEGKNDLINASLIYRVMKRTETRRGLGGIFF